MIYIVAFGVGLKCPCKIHLNTQVPTLKKFWCYISDLTPCDYWIFSYIERLVFSELKGFPVLRPECLQDLKQKLMAVCRYIENKESHLIKKAMSNFVVSVEICSN